MAATTRRLKVVLIGDLMADVWWRAAPSNKNVEHAAMALVSQPGCKKISPGGVGIVAEALARAGAEVDLFSTVGVQPETMTVLRRLNRLHVNTKFVARDPDFFTPIKTRYVNQNGHILLRHDVERRSDTRANLIDAVERCVQDADMVAVSDYAKGCITQIDRRRIVELSQRYSKPLIVDAKPSVIIDYAGATAFKLNRIETEIIAGPAASLQEAAKICCDKLNAAIFISTDGENGAVWATSAVSGAVASPKKYSSGNCVGAGDIFLAGLLLGLPSRSNITDTCLSDLELERAVFTGIIAAGQRVRANGFKSFSLASISKEIARRQNTAVLATLPRFC